jgi:hypothetical protein
LVYCRQDGVPLEQAFDELDDGPETVIRSSSPEIVTEEFVQETGQSPAPVPEIAKKRSIMIPILLISLLLAVIAGGLGGIFLFSYSEGRMPWQSGGAAVEPKENKQSETPVTGEAKIKQDVEKRLREWIALAEARKLEPYMAFYATRLRYYNKKSATKSFVRNDKKKAFAKYSKIDISISRLAIRISDKKDRAASEFDKEWLFLAGTKKNTGKVRSHVEFRLMDGAWKIVSERDIKVYYVEK